MRVCVCSMAMLLLLSQTGAGLATARELYVNNITGNDDLSGQSPEPDGTGGPVASINAALRKALPGDRIEIANTEQPYREQLSIFGCNLFGYEDRPLTLAGNGAVLDGTVIAEHGAWKHVEGDVFALRPRRLSYQQLFNDGKPMRRVGVVSLRGVDLALQPLEWAMAEGRILTRVEAGSLPAAYAFRHAGLQAGVTLYNTRHVVIENLVVQGFQQDGINAHELVRDCVLRGVECRANGRSGLSVGGVSSVRVLQSNFYDNGRSQVRAEGLSSVSLESCEVEAPEDAQRFRLHGGAITADGAPAE